MLKRIQNNNFLKTLTFVLIMAIASMTMPFNFSYAQTNPMTSLIGIRFYPEDSMKFSFFFDQLPVSSEDMTQKEAKRFIEYFLAGLTIPEQDWWVNLSAYESDKVIPLGLGFTKAGQDMLDQDYVLKQAASSLTHPDTPLGKQFWHQVYELAEQKFGTVDIPIDVFNKVWIVPEKAMVYQETQQAVLGDIRFQVMMETDYLATMKEQGLTDILSTSPEKNDSDLEGIVQKITKEIVIPVLEKEVNQGDAFLILRQIFQALVLSTWFKDYLKEHIVSQVYADQQKITGIADDTQEKVESIYQEYLQTYQRGAYHLIREDMDIEEESIPRRYFSGGVVVGDKRKLPLTVSDDLKKLPDSVQTVDFRLTPTDHKQDFAQAISKSISTSLATTSVQSGKGQLFIIKKDRLNPAEIKALGVLTSLDFLVENLDEALPPATFRQRMGLSRQTPRQALKNLIKDIGVDFKENENNEQYDIYTSILNLIDYYDKEGLFSKIKVGTESLLDIVRRTIASPYQIPHAPGTTTQKQQENQDQQYGKLSRIFDFILAEVMRKSEGEASSINEMYQMMLMDIKSQAYNNHLMLKTVFNHFEDGETLVHELEQRRVIQPFTLNRYSLSANFLTMKESFLKENPHRENQVDKIWALLEREWSHEYRNYTAEGYVHLMTENLQFLIHAAKQKIKQGQANAVTHKNIASWTDMLSILETVSDSVIADWNWHTLELRQIVYNISYQKLKRSYDMVLAYQKQIQKNLKGSVDPRLEEQGQIILQYFTEVIHTLDDLLKSPTIDEHKEALGQKTDSQVKGYEYFITQKAIENVLQNQSPDLQGQYRPLLSSWGDLIVRHADTELPSVQQTQGDVNLAIDFLLTPTQYQQMQKHFQGTLKNIVLIGDLGGLTAHFALLAKADNVGTVIINNEQSISLLKEIPSGEEVVVWQEGDQTFLQKNADVEGKIDIISKKQRIQNFFMDFENFNRWFQGRSDLPYVLTNADTPEAIEEAHQRGSKGTGLVRTENLLGDFLPTRSFWREQFLEISKAAGNLPVVIRAIDLQQDKLPLMLSHIKIPKEQRFYFEHSVGIQVFKEQIRALLDVRATGAENLRFLFPMINHLEDWNQIQKIIQEVLQEPDFQFLRGRIPISMGIMIETKAAFERFEELLKNPSIHFFSVGTNDLTADVYQVSRLDPQAGQYFEQINPSIVRMIIEMAKQNNDYNQIMKRQLQGIADIPSKGFRVCGDLASHPLFWFIQYTLRQQGLKVDLSMPSSSIPLFNAFHLFLDDFYLKNKATSTEDRSSQDNLLFTLSDLIHQLSSEPLSMQEIDDAYREDLNKMLTTIFQLAEESVFQKIQNSDASMSSEFKKGGIDLRTFRESLQYERPLESISVKTPQGDVQTIGGSHFQGFSFEITNIRI